MMVFMILIAQVGYAAKECKMLQTGTYTECVMKFVISTEATAAIIYGSELIKTESGNEYCFRVDGSYSQKITYSDFKMNYEMSLIKGAGPQSFVIEQARERGGRAPHSSYSANFKGVYHSLTCQN